MSFADAVRDAEAGNGVEFDGVGMPGGGASRYDSTVDLVRASIADLHSSVGAFKKDFGKVHTSSDSADLRKRL